MMSQKNKKEIKEIDKIGEKIKIEKFGKNFENIGKSLNERIEEQIQQMKEMGRKLEINNNLQKLNESIKPLLNVPTITVPNTIFNNLSLSFIKNIASHLNSNLSGIASIGESLRKLQHPISPIVEYAKKNKDKIENYLESSQIIIEQFKNKYNISEEDAMNMLDQMFEDGKIILTNDWRLLVIEEVDDKSGTISKSEFKLTISDLIFFIGIILELYSLVIGGIPEINYIENQYNNYEINYHINEINQLDNQYIVVNDTNLFESDDPEADVITQLHAGDKINKIAVKDDLMLVAILNEDNQIKYSGWIRVDDVTLID